MADGARAALGADVGIGITGVAGPDGGTPAKPVGYVCLCVTTSSGIRPGPRPAAAGRAAPTCATGPSTPGCTCCCARPVTRSRRRPRRPLRSERGSRRPVAGYARPASPAAPRRRVLARGEGDGRVRMIRRRGLVPGARPLRRRTMPPDPAAGRPLFGDGLAIGPDLEGAAEVALAQALAPLDGVAPTSCACSSRPASPLGAGPSRAAARQVMSACGARHHDRRHGRGGVRRRPRRRTRPGGRGLGRDPARRPDAPVPAGRAARTDGPSGARRRRRRRRRAARRPAHVSRSPGSCRTPARLPGGRRAWRARAAGPGRTGCSSTARCTRTAPSGCSSAATCAVGTAGEPGLPPDRAADDRHPGRAQRPARAGRGTGAAAAGRRS